jgi:hypothetical protein
MNANTAKRNSRRLRRAATALDNMVMLGHGEEVICTDFNQSRMTYGYLNSSVEVRISLITTVVYYLHQDDRDLAEGLAVALDARCEQRGSHL